MNALSQLRRACSEPCFAWMQLRLLPERPRQHGRFPRQVVHGDRGTQPEAEDELPARGTGLQHLPSCCPAPAPTTCLEVLISLQHLITGTDPWAPHLAHCGLGELKHVHFGRVLEAPATKCCRPRAQRHRRSLRAKHCSRSRTRTGAAAAAFIWKGSGKEHAHPGAANQKSLF